LENQQPSDYLTDGAFNNLINAIKEREPTTSEAAELLLCLALCPHGLTPENVRALIRRELVEPSTPASPTPPPLPVHW
jgi:hypothetical protein